MAAATKKTTAKKPARAKKPNAREQGFPDIYLGENGSFKPGMDARAKSDLVAAVLGIESKDSIFTGIAEEAQKLIDARGWGSAVSARRKSILAKQKAKVAKANGKEQA